MVVAVAQVVQDSSSTHVHPSPGSYIVVGAGGMDQEMDHQVE